MQGSIERPQLFNILLYDMFLFQNIKSFVSCADDNMPYCLGKCLEEVIDKLEALSGTIFHWFKNSGIIANPEKCHMLVSSNRSFAANIGEIKISDAKTEKLLRLIFHD